ncbi:MAG: SLC13 family permease [Phycisphaerae bacterium]|nr:SLC13 family permease [Phycisphaerae bacterium]
MTLELGMILALLAAAVAMFALNKPRMDAVSLIMITLMPLTGVLTAGEALAGFSDPNIVLIAALFVIGDGLVRTGVAQRLGDWLTVTAGSSETRMIALLMVVVAGLGSMMSSTAVTAIFIPVALRIAHQTGRSPGRLMMPLSAAALISGMLTLVATAPNLVVNSELVRQGHTGFSFFSLTPFGIPVLFLGIVYMLIARRWLPAAPAKDAAEPGETPGIANWIEEYRLADRERRFRIAEGSPLDGRHLSELDLRATAGVNIIAIERPGRVGANLLHPTPQTELRVGDTILVDLPDPEAAELLALPGLEPLPLGSAYFNDLTQEIGMAEVIIPTDSSLVGKSLEEAKFRTRTGLTVIGVKHGRVAVGRCITQERLSIGDTLLVVGRWKDIKRIRPDDSGVLILRLPTEVQELLPVPGKAAYAVGCLLLVIGLMVSGVVPNVQAALIGCLLMGAFGCVTLESAYRCVSWKTIVLIVGMLPFSIALQRTGGVELAADALMSITSGAGPRVILMCLFIITACLGLFISNTATAVLMAPVALAVSYDLHASPYPFAMIVALAASTAFMTPVSSPVNTLVVTPGNYKFGDFVKIGTPFSIVVMIIAVLLVPVLLPVFPK